MSPAVGGPHGQWSRRELFARVITLGTDLSDQPHQTVGIYAPNGVGWVIAQLACAFAGKIVVPLPTFFSAAQLGHVVRDPPVHLILPSDQTPPLPVRSS